MAVIDIAADFTRRTDCWFPDFLRLARKHLTPTEDASAVDWINRHIFDAALSDTKRRMNVTEAVRRFIPSHPDWTGTALQPLYDRTGRDDVNAARVYGNLICWVGIRRPEQWWCYPEPVAEDRFSRTYILHAQLASYI